jgi:hypothetical protein
MHYDRRCESLWPNNLSHFNIFLLSKFQDVTDDICGAQEVGIKGILVRSGKVFDESAPDFPDCDVLDDFSQAVDLIAEKFRN